MLKIDTTLSTYKNKNTTPQIFRKLFTEVQTKDNHKFTYIYTDGSHTNTITSLAITNETHCIKIGLLPHYSSVFSAE